MRTDSPTDRSRPEPLTEIVGYLKSRYDTDVDLIQHDRDPRDRRADPITYRLNLGIVAIAFQFVYEGEEGWQATIGYGFADDTVIECVEQRHSSMRDACDEADKRIVEMLDDLREDLE